MALVTTSVMSNATTSKSATDSLPMMLCAYRRAAEMLVISGARRHAACKATLLVLLAQHSVEPVYHLRRTLWRAWHDSNVRRRCLEVAPKRSEEHTSELQSRQY